jgi:hypothetical protein
MEPLPRIAILVIVSSCSLFRELPFGPSNFPTKLNWKERKKSVTTSEVLMFVNVKILLCWM